MKKILQREVEVAFSRHAQPLWFRILKYPVFLGAGYLLRNNPYRWWILAAVLMGAIALHFFYRYKTKGWTRSYGAWNYEKNQPRQRTP